jgi:hypothetical protein
MSAPMWGEQLDVPFGGVERQVFKVKQSRHPLAPKMQKLYNAIEHHPKMDNRNVRKRNAKLAEQLMEGVRAGMGLMAYNLAELYYNGAPGVHKDWNKTLELYITMMEAPDAAENATNREFQQALFMNLLGVIDSMEVDGIAPVEARLQAACARPQWRELPAARLAALYGSARLANVQSRRATAAESWRQALKLWDDLQDQPMMLRYCIHARHQIAKMQNTHDHNGDDEQIAAGMVTIDAERDAALAALDPAIQAMPCSASLDSSSNTHHQEPDRIVSNMKLSAPAGLSKEDVKKRVEQQFRDATAQVPGAGDFDWDIQVADRAEKMCESCGTTALLGNMVGEGLTRLFACSRCDAVYYCSKACQRSHWKKHKASCAAAPRGRGVDSELSVSASIDPRQQL